MRIVAQLFREEEFPLSAIRFYSVGLILFMIPYTRPIFVILIPWVILISISIILYFQKNWKLKTVFNLIFVYIIAQSIETWGVKNAEIFGAYAYLNALGPKFLSTPLLIGINWILVGLGAHALAQSMVNNRIAKVFLASSLMVLYDLSIEYVAPTLEMWTFGQAFPPLKNFITWFLVSLSIQLSFELTGLNSKNSYARTLFIIQVMFFIICTAYALILIK